MKNLPLDRQKIIAANRAQLRDRVKPDEHFIHCHWASERALVAFIPPSARTLLDLGCGPTGGLLMHLQDLTYIGLDLVHEYTVSLQRRHTPTGPWEFARRAWLTSTMETLPFPDAYFDVVYSRHSLEHSPYLPAALDEIHRVLKPGGRFLFCVPARVDDIEPTHFTRWPGRRWAAAFSRVGHVRHQAHHDFFIDEFYGFVEKPGGSKAPWLNRLRRAVDFWYGQGLLPLWVLRLLVSTRSRFRRLAGLQD
jgi:SAM-dependent methyltransferase